MVFQTQGTRLQALVTPNKGLEWSVVLHDDDVKTTRNILHYGLKYIVQSIFNLVLYKSWLQIYLPDKNSLKIFQ